MEGYNRYGSVRGRPDLIFRSRTATVKGPLLAMPSSSRRDKIIQ